MWPFDSGNSTSSAPPADPSSNPTVQAWIKAHGAIVGTPYAVDPKLKDGSVNPNPTYDIVFSDGAHMTMDASGAVKSAVEPKGAKVNAPYDHYYRAADGTEHGVKADGTDVVINSTPTPAKPPAAPRTVRTSDGLYQWDPTANDWKPATDASGQPLPATTGKPKPSPLNQWVPVPDPNNPGQTADLLDPVTGQTIKATEAPWDAAEITAHLDAQTGLANAQAQLDSYKADQTQAQADLDRANTAYRQALTSQVVPEQAALLASKVQEAQQRIQDDQAMIQQRQATIDLIKAKTGLIPSQEALNTAHANQANSVAALNAARTATQGAVANKDNAQAAKALQLSPNTVASYLPQLNPDTNAIEWVPNKNQLTVNDAILNLYGSLSPLVKGGDIPLDTAKDLLTAASNQMNQALSYASNVTDNAEKMAQSANDYAVGPGTNAFVSARLAGQPGTPPQPLTQLPYDPATFAANIAAAALAHISPAAFAHHQAVQSGQQPPAVNPDAQPQAQPTFTAPQPATSGHTINITIGGSGDGNLAPPGIAGTAQDPVIQADTPPPPDARAYSMPAFTSPGSPTRGALAG